MTTRHEAPFGMRRILPTKNVGDPQSEFYIPTFCVRVEFDNEIALEDYNNPYKRLTDVSLCIIRK
jgi:hypothetical protein